MANSDALSSSAVTVAAGATLSVGPQVAATVPSLSNSGLVDVGLGSLTVTTGQTGDSVTAAIVAVLNGGNAGITSSDAAAIAFRAVGWLDNGDGSVTFGFAAEGDTNLDGLVDLGDLQNILASGKYGTGTPAVWAEGDFNFDGVIDLQDLQDVLASGLYGHAGYNSALSRFALGSAGSLGGGMLVPHAVPEPSGAMLSAMAVAAIGVAGAARRRRNRRLGA